MLFFFYFNSKEYFDSKSINIIKFVVDEIHDCFCWASQNSKEDSYL